MKNITKSDDGYYHVKGHKYELLIGSRAQVWHGTAYKTSGQLCKNDLFKNKHGRVVSKSKYHSSKKEKRLLKYGYGFTKKKFVPQHRHSKKHRGGSSSKPTPTTTPTTNPSTSLANAINATTPKQSGGTYSIPNATGVADGASTWNSSKWGNDQTPNDLQQYASAFGGKTRRRHRKHKKSRGGMYGQSNMDIATNSEKWNSSKWGNDQSPGNLQLMVTNFGGKSRRKSRRCHCKHKHCKHKKSRGGTYSISNNSVADNAEKWNPKWGNDKGNSLQQYASTFGGKSRRRHRKHKKSRGGYYAVSNISAQDAAPVNSSTGYSSVSSSSGSNNSSGPTAHTQKDSFTTSASY